MAICTPQGTENSIRVLWRIQTISHRRYGKASRERLCRSCLEQTLVKPSYRERKQRPFVVWQESRSVDLSDKSETVAFQQSRYLLVMGGETMSTRSSRDVISSAMQSSHHCESRGASRRALPIEMASFTVRLPKSEWLQSELAKLLPRLASHRESTIQSKLAILEEMQHTIRWNHPEPITGSILVSC